MDIDHHHHHHHHQTVPRSTTSHKKGRKPKQKDDSSLKVVYISNPMKVRTNASRFRSLVQELTGKNSDIAQYMDDAKGANEFHDDNELLAKKSSGLQSLSSVSSDDTTTTTPTTSESFLGSMDNVITSQMVEQFGGILPSDPYYLDVLGGYNDLM